MNDNEKLIEEAARMIAEFAAHDGPVDAFHTAKVMIGMFEKAHTPTDDEREALSEASRRLSEGLDPDMRDGWTVLPDDLLADFRAVMAATRRWKAGPFAPDWDMDAAARRVKAREDALLSEPQSEPSDAQVLAALNTTVRPAATAPDLTYWHELTVKNMRAALRAAWGAR